MSFVHLNQFIESHHGKSGLERIVSRLSEPAARILCSKYLPEWYPVSRMVECERTLIEVLYDGDYTKASMVGELSASLSLNRIYCFQLRTLQPSFLLEQVTKLWPLWFNQGEVTIERTGVSSALVRLHGFDPEHQVFCNDIGGRLVGILKICGAKEANYRHTDCVLQDAQASIFEVEWSP